MKYELFLFKMKPSDIFSFIIFLNNKLFSYSWGQLFTPTNKLNLHLILTKFVFYKMLKDYEFDESGIVFLEGIQLAFIILYYFRYNKQFVFCQTIQTIQGRKNYEFYRLLSI